ncbi:hypothetical protein ZIOFF_046553 [Zingiber officinale]|uniref:Uncharacterized protein n=1 Tax=Zingiber officinale TaxID=94328 RepID=A0A8J5FMV4_ZINOF|nr:hypothetical protein ZIOFF_046553 [Zingiber officinale]
MIRVEGDMERRNGVGDTEFEELEAVPTSSVIEGPLEPITSVATSALDVADDVFVNFFSNAMNTGNASNGTVAGQSHLAAAPIPVTTHASSVNPSTLPTVPSIPIPSASSVPLVKPLDNLESGNGSGSHAMNLVKPSFFSPALSSALVMPPVSSSVPTAPPLHPPVTMQRPYGTPLLQPFPPPTPSASLTPSQNFGSVITRDKVRDALLRVVQVSYFPLFFTFSLPSFLLFSDLR